MQPSDLNDLALMHADPEVMQGSTGTARGRERTESSAWLAHALSSTDKPWHRTFRVEDRRDHIFVGRCGLRPDAAGSETEIAYAFVRDAWGKGFATEAARAVIEWGIGMGLTRLTARALDGNFASQHVLEKLGMRSTGHRTTHEGDVVIYELDAS
jgi:RimJ/RimL family protein N-acetyltransferase